MKQKKIKSKIIVFISFLIVILYIFAYCHARSNFNRGQVVFYKSGDVVEYGGLKYKFSAKIYTLEELVDMYGDYIRQLDMSNSSIEKYYILVKKEYERVAESDGKERRTTSYMVTSKYWSVGVEPDIQEYIQPKGYIREEELKVGESSEGYQVFSIPKCSHTKSVWDNVYNAKVYFEMPDYASSEYLRKVELIN